jgi:hypothetical protein
MALSTGTRTGQQRRGPTKPMGDGGGSGTRWPGSDSRTPLDACPIMRIAIKFLVGLHNCCWD